MNDINSINNKRAKFAYDELQKISNGKSKFRSLARSFPTMVQVNGLTAAVAFLFSKKSEKNEQGRMYDIIYQWLQKPECIYKFEESDLMCAVTKMNSEELRLATTEVMALLVWVKRFAEGMFESNG